MVTASGIARGHRFEPGSFNMIFGPAGAFLNLPGPDGTVWWSARVFDYYSGRLPAAKPERS
jgi:hypothetical protein